MESEALNALVTSAIWHAQQLEESGIAATQAWAEVSSIEEELAKALPVSDGEGRIARRGAVRAALKAANYERAKQLADRYSTEKGAPKALKTALADMLAGHFREMEGRFPLKSRGKWMLVGVGFNFGLQVIISLGCKAFAYSAASSTTYVPRGTALIIVLGFTLGAYFVGGFCIGWMNEKRRIGDAAIAAVLILVLTVLVYAALPTVNRGQFVSGTWLGTAAGHLAFTWQGLVFIIAALVASGAGSYAAWHMTAPSEGLFEPVALLLGLIGAVVGPFVLLAIGGEDSNSPKEPGLPWYLLVIVLVLVLIVVGAGFLMFAKQSQEAEEISISPDRKEP